MKIDLKDTTFVILIRLDSIIRLENLIMTIDCIQKYFDTNIFVLEVSSYSNGIIPFLLKNIDYYFINDNDPVFYRTKYINMMIMKVKTSIISIWDVDVILDAEQIWDSVQQLRDNNCDVAYPYDGTFLDTSDILRNYYWIHRDIDFLKKHKGKMMPLYSVEGVIGAVGGAFFIKTESYINSGMECEDFYGWGMEDGERYYRWLELGYIIYRSKECIYHLSHPRDLNGMFRSENHQYKAEHDFNEVINYGREDLRKKCVN